MGFLTKGASRKRTICEVQREIYDELEKIEGTEKAIILLTEAFDMAKRISAKLVEYKNSVTEVEPIVNKPNPDFLEARKYREGRE